MRVEVILNELRLGLRRNVTMTAASVVVVTLTLTLLGIALVVRQGTQATEREFLNQLNVSVYLQQTCGTPNAPSDCLTPSDRTNIQKTLQQLPQVKSIEYVSPAKAQQIFRQEFASSPDLVNATPEGALPESFIVKLKDPHQYSIIKSAVSQAPGVQSVADASSVLKKMFTIFNHISTLVLGFAAALVIATVLLIYNAMRLAAFTRRRETGIMRLVGASDLFIQAPFVLEGVTIGLIGGVLATGLLCLSKVVLHQTLDVQLLHQLGTWSTLLGVLPWLWVVAIILPGLAAFLTLQRHLRV